MCPVITPHAYGPNEAQASRSFTKYFLRAFGHLAAGWAVPDAQIQRA